MPVDLLRPIPNSWAAYRAALNKCDQRQRPNNFSIFHNMHVRPTMTQMSWVATISEAQQIIENNSTWDAYDIKVLLGMKHEGKDWGLLGHMRDTAKDALDCRQTEIRGILRRLLNVAGTTTFTEAAVGAIEQIKGTHIGISVATRLITLARPDCAVSINEPSAHGFAKLFHGLPKTPHSLGNAKNYPALLSYIYEQPWYQSSAPSGTLDQTLWSMRAALLDAFVFEEE